MMAHETGYILDHIDEYKRIQDVNQRQYIFFV